MNSNGGSVFTTLRPIQYATKKNYRHKIKKNYSTGTLGGAAECFWSHGARPYEFFFSVGGFDYFGRQLSPRLRRTHARTYFRSLLGHVRWRWDQRAEYRP